MKLADRQVVWLVLKPAVLGLLVVLVIYSIFTLAVYLREVILGEALLSQLLQRVLLRNVVVLEILLPTTFFFGLVYAMTTWHRDGEAHAYYAAGVSPWRIERMLYVVSLVVGVLTLVVTTLLRPWGYDTLEKLDAAISGRLQSVIRPDEFSESRGIVATARSVDQETGVLTDVFVYRRLETQSEVIRARSALLGEREASGITPIEFTDGYSYSFDATSRLLRTTRFDTMRFLHRQPPVNQYQRRQARPTADLATAQTIKEISEYQWRFTVPMLAVALGVLGVMLGRLQPDQPAYPRYLLALLLYVGVFNLASATRSAMENGQIEASPGMFVAPAVIAALILLWTALRGNRVDRPA
ncbi:MAG: LptF/LptG family permease [Pseudomonadales bacterium]